MNLWKLQGRRFGFNTYIKKYLKLQLSKIEEVILGGCVMPLTTGGFLEQKALVVGGN